ncbi:MAG: anthranilate synthase component I family protein [Saprospiraceae bacterium]|nr:anthranilate synthase component I family protein [Saprospiraceae bacterium]
MHHIISNTKVLLADTVTAVNLYLRLRDRYPGALLLESSDYHGNENSVSFLCLSPLAEFIVDNEQVTEQLPGEAATHFTLINSAEALTSLTDFFQKIQLDSVDATQQRMNGFFGYCTYDAVQHFEKINLQNPVNPKRAIPTIRYQLPRFIVAINHFNQQMTVLENSLPGEASHLPELENLLQVAPVPTFPFSTVGEETTNMTDEDYVKMVTLGKHHCQRGDVFQIVLARQFSQQFQGDDFNVYRALRSVNPSPYLFYFDYGGYKIFGSSPEAQVRLKQSTVGSGQLAVTSRKAFINPIAGTFPRSGDDHADRLGAEALAADPKENAEHVMLVDLARNDLNRLCRNVKVETYREVQFYSHVIHLVSEVSGELPEGVSPVKLLAETFPAGTLSGAPKHRAMQLIDQIEPNRRGYYGGCVGFFTFSGETNHAILIRSFLSKNNRLHYQAGAGIVKHSVEEKELAEVFHKIGALRRAVDRAVIWE